MGPQLFNRPVIGRAFGKCRKAGSAFGADQRGSVAIWVGVALTVFIGCAGLAVDTARGYMLKARLSQALDAAALAGAKQLGSDKVDSDITMFFNANFPAAQLEATLDGPHVVQDLANNTVNVDAKASINTTLMSVLGFKKITVGAAASAVRGINGLDVVIAIDISGSMCKPCTKIEAAQSAAKLLVDTVYADPNPKEVTISGVTYPLLNIGMVPWGGKVNVSDDGATYDPDKVVTEPVGSNFTNPVTGVTQSDIYFAKDFTDVRLLSKPPAGWKGGVYARYIDDNNNTNDSDLKLGYGTYGGKSWIAYEPILPGQGEPINPETVKWDLTTGGTWGNGKYAQCAEAYWNDNGLAKTDHPTGTSGIIDRPSYWVKGNQGSATSQGNDCTPVPGPGIRRLLPVRNATEKAAMVTSINNLFKGVDTLSEHYTDTPQGLFWAWEVLMPGKPFDEGKASVPFNRTQAIVLLTDGIATGANGDSYKGAFGFYTTAATTTSHGKLGDGSYNNKNNRLKQLATAIKGANPAQGVKIYVVQYDEPDATLKALLQSVATGKNAPYYYQASSATDLEAAFKSIAASLSVLRLSK
ncbi:pilus assembly protein TadG-related protein [Dongia rigui]|uniref:Pilus assembly protein TadG-related protein n=1 Tax=Dongia rigui TaxID=940149 RepID=A0ABU5DU87_9PROT|nr:pilus assembly protein TadG-related protein [Dongia rigui]MDY0870763.1 pilus assembly protein TadG-related protein [Dongia rigui]